MSNGLILRIIYTLQFSSVAQSCPTFCDPMNCSMPGLHVMTNSQSSLRLTSIESEMPSSHLIRCRPLLLLPPIPPSIRVFSNESTLLKLTNYRCQLYLQNILMIFFETSNVIRSDKISHSVVSDSLLPHESQHARPPCPSPTPGVH